MTLLSRGRVISFSNPGAEMQTALHAREFEKGGRVVSVEVASAAQCAERLVAQAEAKVAALLAQFEQETDNIRAGMRTQAKAEAQLEFVRQVLDLTTVRQEIVQRAEKDIVDVARLLAERIIAEELTLRPDRLLALARQTLRESRGARTITIHAAPRDAERLLGEIEKLTVDTNSSITVLTDATLGRGDFRIETDVGSIDARVSTQLAHLASTIVESMRS